LNSTDRLRGSLFTDSSNKGDGETNTSEYDNGMSVGQWSNTNWFYRTADGGCPLLCIGVGLVALGGVGVAVLANDSTPVIQCSSTVRYWRIMTSGLVRVHPPEIHETKKATM
jgi:hypothetical protein